MASVLPAADILLAGYVVVFGAAAVVCFGSVRRTRSIEDPDTRRGLVWLLITSGAWASSQVGFLLGPTPQVRTAFYMAGLVVGLSTVGPWLYFCSAYTGRTLHRDETYQRIVLAVFLGFVAIKLTNPIHGLYFTTEFVAVPFEHLSVRHGLAHWITMGVAYALATVGYFMLVELFTRVSYDTKPLLALIAVTGLPVVLDIVGFATPYLVDISYQPLGVAAFAVGVLFVYLGRFQAVTAAGGRTEPVIVLDEADHIREYNEQARELLPELTNPDVTGKPLWVVLPNVADTLERAPPVLAIDRGDETRYFRLSENPFAAGQTQLGQLLVFTEITGQERYRQRLERQNERLERFVNMVSHDLRNPLNVASLRVSMAREEGDSEHLEATERALDRMEELIEDLLALARQGQSIDEFERVRLSGVAERSWEMIASDGELHVESDRTFLADPDRLQQLLENLFRNAVEHGSTGSRTEEGSDDAVEHGSTGSQSEADSDDAGERSVGVEGGDRDVTIRVGTLEGGFYVADDGSGIPEEEREEIFEAGYTTAESGTGFGLAIVAEIVEAHGWEIRTTESETGGARFEITGLEDVE